MIRANHTWGSRCGDIPDAIVWNIILSYRSDPRRILYLFQAFPQSYGVISHNFTFS